MPAPREPVPQERVQGPHLLKKETSQSTGQFSVPHAWVILRARHAKPPKAGLVTTVRVLVWEPVPQLRVHADHSVKAERTQSTGQAWVLQSLCSMREGHT